MRVLKYPLELGVTPIDLPVDSEVLTVIEQNSCLQLYVKVGDHVNCELFNILTVETGKRISDKAKYIGTVGTSYVTHTFLLE